MKKIDRNDVTAVILAGGKGRRMGGQDKGLVHYKNTTLIKHVIDALRLQTDNIMINANRNLEKYAEYGYPVVQDTLSDFQGPLAGFMAAMSMARSDYILTLPCDSPAIDGHYLERMIQAKNQGHSDIVVASDGQRLQPVYALIAVKLKPSLHAFLSAGGRKVDLWYQQHDFSLVEFTDDSSLFTNMNAPEDIIKHS